MSKHTPQKLLIEVDGVPQRHLVHLHPQAQSIMMAKCRSVLDKFPMEEQDVEYQAIPDDPDLWFKSK